MKNQTIHPWVVGSGQENADPSLGDAEASQTRIALLSRFMAGCCVMMMVGVALYALLAMVLAWVPSLSAGSSASLALISFVGWICSLAALIWGLWNGRACFAGLARGALFSRRTIAGLRNFALGLLVYKAIPPMALIALMVVSKFSAIQLPPGTGITAQDMGEGMFTLASLGAVVVIAAVLTRAAQIADDNASIV
jgi:hypothetical protein